MKIISWNTRGRLNKSKQLALKSVLKLTNLAVVLIQVTKQEAIDKSLIKALWSSDVIGWVTGILLIQPVDQEEF